MATTLSTLRFHDEERGIYSMKVADELDCSDADATLATMTWEKPAYVTGLAALFGVTVEPSDVATNSGLMFEALIDPENPSEEKAWLTPRACTGLEAAIAFNGGTFSGVTGFGARYNGPNAIFTEANRKAGAFLHFSYNTATNTVPIRWGIFGMRVRHFNGSSSAAGTLKYFWLHAVTV